MRYTKGKIIVTGNPTLAWVEKMQEYNLILTCDGGIIYAELERS